MNALRISLTLAVLFSGPIAACVAQPPSAATATTLTLDQAEKLAIQQNPHVQMTRLIALAEAQTKREARSADLPIVTGNLTAVGVHENSRITAGALNNPIVYQRAAGGVTVSQLLTDFGRTHNLIQSAGLRAQAAVSDQQASIQEIRLAVDQAFYSALASQAVLRVAQQTVTARQAVSDQISALTSAKLRSSLDLSFANVDLQQAKLLLLNATNSSQESQAALNALLGNEQPVNYSLMDETPFAPVPPPDNAPPLIQLALQSRPDLASLNLQASAAKKFTQAERDLQRPTISALGTAGGAPVRADQIATPWYGAAGVNVSIPIFNGFLYSSREKEAALRAQAAYQNVLQRRQVITRDVTNTVLETQSGFQRIDVSRQLLDQANSAFDLAQTRYKLGLSSIVELSQAQLAQTQAQIEYANARYAYQRTLAALRFQTGQ
ncbi:MAG TPA: TolC family protein [Acidobacteriaceae bacterium]